MIVSRRLTTGSTASSESPWKSPDWASTSSTTRPLTRRFDGRAGVRVRRESRRLCALVTRSVGRAVLRPSECARPHCRGDRLRPSAGWRCVPRPLRRRRQRNRARRRPDVGEGVDLAGGGAVEELGDLAGAGRLAQRLLDPLHDQQERDQQRREEDDAERDHVDLPPAVAAADLPGARCVDDDTERVPVSPAAYPRRRVDARLRARERPSGPGAPALRPPRPSPSAHPGGPHRRVPLRPGRDARWAAPAGPGAWPASSPSSTPTRTASSTSPTPSSCWSPRCCPRRPPTRWSTRSRRRCSPATRTPIALAGRRPCRASRRSSSRPASSGRRPTRSLGLSQALVERFDGEVPGRMADLVTLPGVGRKTANVVLGNAFGVPGLTVDTHFGRLVRRFGWTAEDDPVKVEAEIAELVPKKEWTDFSHRVIFHGRRVCHAKKAACGACGLAQWCPSYGIGPIDPEVAAEAGQVPGRLGHRVTRRRAAAALVAAVAVLAGCTSFGDAGRPGPPSDPEQPAASAFEACPEQTDEPAAGGSAVPPLSFDCLGGGSLDLDPRPRRAHRRQPLGELVRAVPRGTAADAGARRHRRRPRARRRDRQQGRRAAGRVVRGRCGHDVPQRVRRRRGPHGGAGPQRPAVHDVPRRRRQRSCTASSARSSPPRSCSNWSPTTSVCSCERGRRRRRRRPARVPAAAARRRRRPAAAASHAAGERDRAPVGRADPLR